MTSTYAAIRCPSCGSNAVIPAEGGRVFCRSCDGLFERSTPGKESSKGVSAPLETPPEISQEDHPKEIAKLSEADWTAMLVCVAIPLVGLSVAWFLGFFR